MSSPVLQCSWVPGDSVPILAVLKLPRPYDFVLSTERFRVCGPDLANLWDGEALLRAVGGREVRIAAAPGGVDVEPLDAAIDDDEVRARLVALPGIGEWMGDWLLARHLARLRVWPAGDLGLRKAVSAFYADGRLLGTDEVRDFGARFEPWQNLTAHYLLT